MSASRVIVVGAVNTDLVIHAAHLPAPGETVVGGGLETFGGGKGANAAVAAARAGANVHLIAAVGDDDNGAHALALLEHDGVNTASVARLDGVPTGAALIVVDDAGENQIALGPGANGALTAATVEQHLSPLLAPNAVVLVSTEIPLAAVTAAIRCTTAANLTCILNPAPVIDGLEQLLEHGPILTPNEIELVELLRRLNHAAPGDESGLIAGLSALVRATGAAAITTLGARGCRALAPGGEVLSVAAHHGIEVADTTGAGDTFNGVFAACLAAGDDLAVAARTAVVAASLSVTALGARAGMPQRNAIDAALNG